MKNLIKQFKKSLVKIDFNISSKTAILTLSVVSILFFFPAFFQNKIALPVDGLVGAHVPWTETKWPDYPAGIPIKNLEITDAFSQFYPWRSLAGEFWREGEFPLWNHYMFSGTPFLAALHSAAVYPLNFVYLFFSNIGAWNLIVFLQIILSFIFMFLFLKELTKDSLASIFGAVMFGFSGYMIAWLEFATGGHAGLWLPLLLFLQLKFVRTGKSIYFFGLPIIVFFILTAGDFQVPFYSLLTYFLFSVFLSCKTKKKVKNFMIYVGALIIGLGLSLIQWLPTFELFTKSIRANDTYIQEYYFGLFHWEKIVNFIWPDFFGNVVTRNYWGKFGYHEYLAFCGSLGIVFLIFSFLAKRSEIEKFFGGLLIIALLFLFPTPLAFLPFKFHIPGLGTSSASRILFLVGFCIATLAAYGFAKLDKLNIVKLSKTIFYLLVITSGVFIGIATSLLIFQKSGLDVSLYENLKVSLKNIIPSTAILVISLFVTLVYQRFGFSKVNLLKLFLCVLLVSEMFRFAWKNTPFSETRFVFPETKTTTFLKNNTGMYRIAGGIPLNLFMPYEIKSLEGYDPIYPLKNSQWYSLINAGDLSAISGRYGLVHNFASPLLNISSVKYVVDYKKNPLGQLSDKGSFSSGVTLPRYNEVFDEGRIITFENTKALPIAWVTDNYQVEEGLDDALQKIYDESVVQGKKVILNSTPNVADTDTSLDYIITDLSFGPNKISLVAETSKPSILFLSQTFDDGWKAYINGDEVQIYQADYLYQAVDLPVGKNDINFIYFPKSFRIGLTIFIVLSVGLVLSAAVLRNKKINI